MSIPPLLTRPARSSLAGMWSLGKPVMTTPLANWPDGLSRSTCSSRVGGSHSRSGPARRASHGSQKWSVLRFTFTRGGHHVHAISSFPACGWREYQ